MINISVITVCFDSEETILATIESVASQTHTNIEHIIIDGGSTDNTMAIVLSESANISKVVSEKDRGIFDAMNKGLSLATGDVVGFLNSDDVFASNDCLAVIATAFSDDSIQGCHGDLVYVARDDLTKIVRYWQSGKYEEGMFSRGWVPPHPTFYAKRNLYHKFGMFDCDLQLAADFDVLLRFFVLHRINSVYIPKVLVKMRLGGASNSSFRSILNQNKFVKKSFDKYGFNAGPGLFLFRLYRRLSQFFMRPTAP